MRTVVATTKLTIPVFRRPLMARPRLSAQLDGDYRVALVAAPAGYGKTAALALWAAELGGDVAWLSCDALDAEPMRFMSCLLSAVSSTWPGTADDAFVLLEREGANSYDAAMALINELDGVGATGVLIVDDLHLATPDPALLTAFVDALPAGLRFVAGTRVDPPLSLAKLRLRGDLLELRADDLGFVPEELTGFLGLQDVTLTDDEILRVHALTEGWPAGAQLAAIALQRGAERGDFLDAFTNTDRAVGDFLLSEVLASLPADLVEFLITTSVFEMFDAELCAAVTGVDDAAHVLDRLTTANLFLVPLDEPVRWFRYHHLFGAFLGARLASLGRDRVRRAHMRAARALEERGLVASALRHAMVIDDTDDVERILRASFTRTMNIAEGPADAVRAARLWLYERGDEAVQSDPAWVLELVIGLMGLTQHEDARRWVERVGRAHPEPDGPLRALIEGAWNEYHQNRGQPIEAISRLERSRAAVGGRPPNVGLLPLMAMSTARAHVQAGQFAQAADVLADAEGHPTGNAIADDVRNRGVAAFVAAVAGELRLASDLARKAVEFADHLQLGAHDLGRIYAGLAMVELHAERHDLQDARDVFEQVRVGTEASGRIIMRHLATLQHARLARAGGDEAGAAALLVQAGLEFPDADRAVRHVLAEEAVAQALRFDPSRVRPLLADLDPDRVGTVVIRARLALLEGDGRGAARLLDDLPPATTRRTTVERAVLRALSVLDRDVDEANEHLSRALEAAHPEGLVRALTEHGPAVPKLLLSFTPDSARDRYVERLLSAADDVGVGPVRTPAQQSLVDPLSPRELTVLRYLCSRLTYGEIASALYVSINTLKSHVRTVYRKLAVASRADAVAAGRHLGLI